MQGTGIQGAEEKPPGPRRSAAYIGMNTSIPADIPSMLFLFSGIMSRSVLLIIASVLFAPSHIMISYKNVK